MNDMTPCLTNSKLLCPENRETDQMSSTSGYPVPQTPASHPSMRAVVVGGPLGWQLHTRSEGPARETQQEQPLLLSQVAVVV